MMPLPTSAHVRALAALGLPLVGSNVAQLALHLTNTIMLGWYDVRALAAAALATAFYTMIYLVGSGFGWAVMPLVASATAQGDDTTIRRVTRMGMWLSAFYALLIMPTMIWSRPILLALGQEEVVATLAQTYLRIVGLGLIPTLFTIVLRSYLAAQGRTQVVLLVTVIAVPVNAAINWLLIFGRFGLPEMGVAGAATASLTVQLIGVLLLAFYASRQRDLRSQRLFQRFWRPDRPAMGRVFGLGWPIGLTNLSEAGLFNATAVMMGWLGTTALAAHGIAMELAAVAFMVHMGISNAATVRTGRFLGAGQGRDLRRGAAVALGLSGVFALLVIATFLLAPGALVALFISPAEPERDAVLAVGISLLAAAAVFQLGDAAQALVLGLLRGIQDTRVPMVIAAISYWLVGVPASYLLGFRAGLGPQGIWLGLACGLGLAAVLLMTRFWRQVRAMPDGPALTA